jgi:hypothetical protein
MEVIRAILERRVGGQVLYARFQTFTVPVKDDHHDRHCLRPPCCSLVVRVARRALFAVEGETGPALTRWGQALRAQFPGLRGVVVMSPHWMARGVRVTTGAQPATWHDFGGFSVGAV